MLVNASRLIGCPILSLHVGGKIAEVTEIIVDPNKLQIIALRLEGALLRDDEVGDILPIESVREFSKMGMIIDSIDELVDGDDVIKIKNILKLNFELVGLRVVTQKKAKLGKVADYTVDVGGWQVQQLIVQRPIMKSLLDPQLVISRKKIVEVDDEQVIIKDETEKSSSTVAAGTADFVPNFINPFREPDFADGVEAS